MTLLDTNTNTAAAAAGPSGSAVAAPRRPRARRIAVRVTAAAVLAGGLGWAVTSGHASSGPKPVGVARLALGDVAASAYLVPRTDGRATLVVTGTPQVHLAVTIDGNPTPLTVDAGGVATTTVSDPTTPVTVGVTTPDGHTATARVALPADLPSSVRSDDPDAWLGHALSGRVTPAGSATSTQGHDDPELDGRALIAGLVFRGAHSVAVLTPTSDRGTALVRGISAAAVTAGIRVDAVTSATSPTSLQDDALIVTGERADAIAVRNALSRARRAPVYGVWMAPWLFDRTVLDAGITPGQSAPPCVFTLPIDPQGDAAHGYLAALTEAAPGQPTTYSGLTGWIAEHHQLDVARSWHLVVAGNAAFLPQSLNAGHDHGGAIPDWITNGGVDTASPALTVPVS